MPYGSVNDLPKGIKGSLTPHQQEIWRAAFNAAYHGTCNGDEVCAIKIAWAAARRNK